MPLLLLTAMVALSLMAPHQAAAIHARVRFGQPVAVADSFIAAATRRDLPRLRQLAADSTPVVWMLQLPRLSPPFWRAAVSGYTLRSAAPVAGEPDMVVVDFLVPSRVKHSFCYGLGGRDNLQIALVKLGGTWKVVRAGTDPC